MRALLALVLCSSLAYADPAPPADTKLAPISPLKSVPEASLSPLHFLPSDLARIEHRARTRRAIGIALAAPGLVLMVLGSVMIGIGAQNSRNGPKGIEIDAGTIATGAGILFTIPGAYLWIDGQDTLDTAAWRRQRATP